VSHCGLAIYIKKYLKAKEELWKLKYFTNQKYNFQSILPQKIENLSRYFTQCLFFQIRQVGALARILMK
jgi:hypothetical protein